MAEMRYTRIIRKTLLLSAIGIILSLSIASMCCSGTWNLNKFYDVGEVFDTWNLNDEPAISCNLPSKKSIGIICICMHLMLEIRPFL